MVSLVELPGEEVSNGEGSPMYNTQPSMRGLMAAKYLAHKVKTDLQRWDETIEGLDDMLS